MTLSYLYGIVEQTSPVELDVRGLDGTSRVRVVASGDLGAVVSAHKTAADFHALPRETVLRYLLAYQRVVEHVMERQVVLPVKFGTVLENADEARDLVSRTRTTLGRAFALIRGMVEIEVAATWEISRVLQEIGREPAVASAREAIERHGQPGSEDRLQLGQLVKSHLDLRRVAIRDRALDLLRPLAASVATHALLDDRLVMNEAFLVTSGDLPEIERRVRQLDALLAGQIVFRIIGPLPPYTFCTVDVTRVSAGQLEEARRALGLKGEELDERVVRGAYRRAAAAARRQLSGNASIAEPRFSQLREASELLLGSCRTDSTDRRFGSGRGDRWLAKIRTTGLNDISPASFGGGV